MSPVNFCSTFSRSVFVTWSVKRKKKKSVNNGYSHCTNHHVLQTDKKWYPFSEFRLDEQCQRKINRM